jgi:hypothetical protein
MGKVNSRQGFVVISFEYHRSAGTEVSTDRVTSTSRPRECTVATPQVGETLDEVAFGQPMTVVDSPMWVSRYSVRVEIAAGH